MLRLSIHKSKIAALACSRFSTATNLKIRNLIGGEFVESQSSETIDVLNPATQEVVSQVPLTTNEEFKSAVSAAKQAFPCWRNTPFTLRRRLMLKFQQLIWRDMDKLAKNITMEHGKTLKDARDDVLRGLEAVEHVCRMEDLQTRPFFGYTANGIHTYYTRTPVGVCAGICSFEFPAMVPLWMFPMAITCGNTYVLKPSEKNPGASMMLAELAMEAGLPKGVLNIVHGTHDIVNNICDDNGINVISFVGSNAADIHKCSRAKEAKNHAIVMPDADLDATLDTLIKASFGAAGQRCVELGTIIFVGDSKPWLEGLLERANALKVNAGWEPTADLGPVISKQAKEQICRLIQIGADSGATLVLDGRDIVVPGYEEGNFVGPTILSDVTSDMQCYKERIFGPVLLCMLADSLEEAIQIVNINECCGNGASIFTTSEAVVEKFENEIKTGQGVLIIRFLLHCHFFASLDSRLHLLGISFSTSMKKQLTLNFTPKSRV